MGRVLFAICRTIHSQTNKLTTPLTTEQGNWALVEEGLIEPEFKARAQALLFFANVIAGCQKLSVEFFEHQRRSAAVAVVQVLVDVNVGVGVSVGVNLDVVLFLDSRRRRLD